MWYVEYIGANSIVAFYSQDFDTYQEAQEYANTKRSQGYKVKIKQG